MRKLNSGIDQTAVRGQLTRAVGLRPTQQVPRMLIGTVEILKRAVLLDYKYIDSLARDGIPIIERQIVKACELPNQRHRIHPQRYATLARCNHVSTTVSGLSDIDSMP